MTPVAVLDEESLARIVSAAVAPLVAEIAELRRELRAPRAAPTVTLAQLAAMLDIDERSVRRFVNAGLIPAPMKLSERVMFWPRETIEKWLASGGPAVAQRDRRWGAGQRKRPVSTPVILDSEAMP